MPETSSATVILGKVILRWVGRVIFVGTLLLAAVYVGDFAIFSVRGKPLDQVVVNRYMAAALKGNKTAYYFESSGPEPCARSLFPQGGRTACWQLRRHPVIADQPE